MPSYVGPYIKHGIIATVGSALEAVPTLPEPSPQLTQARVLAGQEVSAGSPVLEHFNHPKDVHAVGVVGLVLSHLIGTGWDAFRPLMEREGVGLWDGVGDGVHVLSRLRYGGEVSVPFGLFLTPLENDDFQCFAALFVRFWGFGHYVLVVSLDPNGCHFFGGLRYERCHLTPAYRNAEEVVRRFLGDHNSGAVFARPASLN